jgi:hypothetical protein
MQASLVCPNCRVPMQAVGVEPSATTPGADDITFRCERCKSEIKRVVPAASIAELRDTTAGDG